MLSSKKRAELKSRANGLEVLIHIGKGGISDSLVTQTLEALEARELIKCRVLETALLSAREACDELAERSGGEGVLAMGNIFVLYKENPKLHMNPPKKKKVNPVKLGAKARLEAKRRQKADSDEYFSKQRREAWKNRER